jgi:hypothetical protein
MANLVEKVTNRLAELDNAPSRKLSSVDRAIELADLYASVKPQEYILPLNAMAGFCRPCDK